jgi:hypothetical protein
LHRALKHETQNPADSIISLLRSWKTSKSAFWTENLQDDDKSRWTDSTENEMILETPARFSENRKSLWGAEAEIIRSHFHADFYAQIDFLASKIRIGDFSPDTLSFEDFLPENPVVAGTDAKVFLRLVKRMPQLQPQYEGSGTISPSPSDGTAMMLVKTSEEMIPDGQQEAFVPYRASVKIPTADGGQIDYRLVGKVKIIRPCDPR